MDRMSEQEQAPPRCEFDTDKLVIKHDEAVLSDVTIIDATVAKIMGVIRQNYCCGDMGNIDLSLREALVNAIVHGNRSNAKKAVRICVPVQPDCGILIIVKDRTGVRAEPPPETRRRSSPARGTWQRHLPNQTTHGRCAL
jgi:anti-sigma regulatory factor (Ser/Thr protein kinase)